MGIMYYSTGVISRSGWIPSQLSPCICWFWVRAALLNRGPIFKMLEFAAPRKILAVGVPQKVTYQI